MKKILLILMVLVVPFIFVSCDDDEIILPQEDFFIAFDAESITLPKRPVNTQLPHQFPVYMAAAASSEPIYVVFEVILEHQEDENGDNGDNAEELDYAEEGIDFQFEGTNDAPDGHIELVYDIGAGYAEGGIRTEYGLKSGDKYMELRLVSNSANYNMGFKYGENADSTSHDRVIIRFIDGVDVTFNINDVEQQQVDDVTVKIGEYIEQTGDYLFIDIPSGSHPIEVSKDNYWTVERDISVGSADMTVDILLELAFKATFNVFDENTNTLDNAVISVKSTTPPPIQTFTFEPGEYQFELPAREFTYTVTLAGYVPGEGSFNLDGDKTINVILEEADDE